MLSISRLKIWLNLKKVLLVSRYFHSQITDPNSYMAHQTLGAIYVAYNRTSEAGKGALLKAMHIKVDSVCEWQWYKPVLLILRISDDFEEGVIPIITKLICTLNLLIIQIGSHKNTDPKSRCTQYKLVLNWHDSRDADVVVVYPPTATFGKKEFPRKGPLHQRG